MNKKNVLAIATILGVLFCTHLLFADTTTVDQATWTTVQNSVPLTATTASLGGGLLSAGACASNTTTVTGATTTMAVQVTPATTTDIGSLALWKGFVSAANTVTVEVCAVVVGTPIATPYNIRVLK